MCGGSGRPRAAAWAPAARRSGGIPRRPRCRPARGGPGPGPHPAAGPRGPGAPARRAPGRGARFPGAAGAVRAVAPRRLRAGQTARTRCCRGGLGRRERRFPEPFPGSRSAAAEPGGFARWVCPALPEDGLGSPPARLRDGHSSGPRACVPAAPGISPLCAGFSEELDVLAVWRRVLEGLGPGRPTQALPNPLFFTFSLSCLWVPRGTLERAGNTHGAPTSHPFSCYITNDLFCLITFWGRFNTKAFYLFFFF